MRGASMHGEIDFLERKLRIRKVGGLVAPAARQTFSSDVTAQSDRRRRSWLLVEKTNGRALGQSAERGFARDLQASGHRGQAAGVVDMPTLASGILPVVRADWHHLQGADERPK